VHPPPPPRLRPTLHVRAVHVLSALPTFGGRAAVRDADRDEMLQFTRFVNLLTRAVYVKYSKYIITRRHDLQREATAVCYYYFNKIIQTDRKFLLSAAPGQNTISEYYYNVWYYALCNKIYFMYTNIMYL